MSARFDDPYYSLENGLAETRYVFLSGNRLPERFHGNFHIAELGFGTGMNFLAAAQMWQLHAPGGQMRFTSFEAYPMKPADMSKALSTFKQTNLPVDRLLELWSPEGGVFELAPDIQLEVIIGDARSTVAHWQGQADAWFLDGFSPAKNPELWCEQLLKDVALHTAPNGTFATYTAAGFVRRGLDAAGFDVERVAGYGRKRHMSRGVLRG
ncbi:tRNA (mnm(5)s(2)U34)-methyltransferase-like protein [Roseobacter litoralis Och 149]|uniref:tRNA (Mnm(5)s(2)U34)-methyltransferase-like protein n=1 Tax=Roseobacter litoralis (strain ATCC 49566 / DSM 6996 / JCM 21268 / NBRC 15278 / OCh 149) TaxID=391595 RepID=F7ZEY0_ROSLO|nr:tRNA (mnm(5)s(2)U34)-methyltransferase-like protein [Roseobacter litoralis Och 149]